MRNGIVGKKWFGKIYLVKFVEIGMKLW